MTEEGARLIALEESMVAGLKQAGIDFIRNGSFPEKHLPGNISLSFKNSDGEMILHRLDLMGICISTGSACDSKNAQVSHVIKAIDVPKDYQEGTIRISLGKENTEQDISILINSLMKILK